MSDEEEERPLQPEGDLADIEAFNLDAYDELMPHIPKVMRPLYRWYARKRGMAP